MWDAPALCMRMSLQMQALSSLSLSYTSPALHPRTSLLRFDVSRHDAGVEPKVERASTVRDRSLARRALAWPADYKCRLSVDVDNARANSSHDHGERRG